MMNLSLNEKLAAMISSLIGEKEDGEKYLSTATNACEFNVELLSVNLRVKHDSVAFTENITDK